MEDLISKIELTICTKNTIDYMYSLCLVYVTQ